jgi:chemotaxis protein CheX
MTPAPSLLDLPVTAEQVAEIAGQVWDSFLGLPLVEAGSADAPTGMVMTGLVAITGAWQGSVVLRCSYEHAVVAAEAMFAAEPGSLDESEIADALGELTNMVGGNIKSLLPEPSALSIPSVTCGNDAHVFVPAARPVLQVGLSCAEAPVQVTVWQV